MARKKAAKTEKPAKSFQHRQEVYGLILFCLGLMILLALVSYNPEDRAWGTSVPAGAEIDNYLGLFGAALARLLREGFGLISFALPALLFWLSSTFFLKQDWNVRLSQFLGFFTLLVCLCAFFHLDISHMADEEKGGLLGHVIGEGLVSLLNSIGAHLILLLVTLLSLMVALRISVVGVLLKVGRALLALGQMVWSTITLRFNQYRKHKSHKLTQSAKTKINASPRISTASIRPNGATKNGATTAKETPEAAQPPKQAPQPANAEDIKVVEREEAESKKPPVKQFSFAEVTGEYELPPTTLLRSMPEKHGDVDRQLLLANSQALTEKLASFGINGSVVEVRPGPIVTMYEFKPAAGVRVTKVANMEKDLALALKSHRIRIVAPLPERGTIGIEVPNINREMVYIREILESENFHDPKWQIPIALGKDIFGGPAVTDLADMPHLLVAGTTGSGKSVFLNCVVMSLMYKHAPDKVRLIMVDPKMLEFQIYEDIPWLLAPVVTNVKNASTVLRQAVDEMERRYRMMAEMGVRNLDGYNKKVEKNNESPEIKKVHKIDDEGNETVLEEPILLQPLPYIVIIIDEFADLMMVAPKEILESVQRLAQMARAAGIHLILATQRPSKDVITGDIKANMAARITFQLRTKTDSRVILDCNGAEALLGKGDMLYLPSRNPKLTRLHGAYISENEIARVVEFAKKSGPAPDVESLFNLSEDRNNNLYADDDFFDERYDEAVQLVMDTKRATISFVQRKLKIGYNRAARIIEQMEHEGLIGAPDHTGAREIFEDHF